MTTGVLSLLIPVSHIILPNTRLTR
jgi:hypothetical protein